MAEQTRSETPTVTEQEATRREGEAFKFGMIAGAIGIVVFGLALTGFISILHWMK